MKVECESSIKTQGGKSITRDEAITFLAALPEDAEFAPIQRNMGSPRDPQDVLVGFRAKWIETRE